MAFRRPLENWFHVPTYFFEIHKEGYSFGMNIFRPSSATMRNFRAKIDDDPDDFERLIRPIHRSRSFKLETEKYKRLFPCDHSEPVFSWYQSRYVEVICRRNADKTLYSPKLPGLLTDGFVRQNFCTISSGLAPIFEFDTGLGNVQKNVSRILFHAKAQRR